MGERGGKGREGEKLRMGGEGRGGPCCGRFSSSHSFEV